MPIQTIASGRAQIAVETAGAGAPVIFLHAGVCDRRMWRHQMGTIGGDHLAIAYDRRGFGETAHAEEPYAHVADLLAVMDALVPGQPAVLVGCSQGGRIAIDTALAHPDRVAGLVLIAPAVSGAPQASYPAAVQSIVDDLDASEAEGDLDRVNALEAHLWLDGPLEPAGRVTGEVRDLFLRMNGIALRAETKGAEQPPPAAYERLGEISTPTLVIWGDLDFPHLQARCRRIADSVPGAGARTLAGAAHLPSMEQPGAVTDLVAGFLGAAMPQGSGAP